MGQAQAQAFKVIPNSSAFTILSLYLRARNAVNRATAILCEHPNEPDMAEMSASFAHFALIYRASAGLDILNNFMVQVAWGARNRKVKVDALVLYRIRCILAAQAKITD